MRGTRRPSGRRLLGRTPPLAASVPLYPLYALLVQPEQPAVRVVGLLELRVRLSVVEPVELVAIVVRRRVQRLAALHLAHDALDAAVGGAVPVAVRERNARP